MSKLGSILLAVQQTTMLEWLTIGSGLLFVLLLAYRKRTAWIFSFVSALFYTILCLYSQLYVRAGIQLFFFVLGIIGWVKWNPNLPVKPLIKTGRLRSHLLMFLFGLLLSFFLGSLFIQFEQNTQLYYEAFALAYSVVATLFLIFKRIEGWIYWLLVDALFSYIYYMREQYLTFLLFSGFTLLVWFGLINWAKEMRPRKPITKIDPPLVDEKL